MWELATNWEWIPFFDDGPLKVYSTRSQASGVRVYTFGPWPRYLHHIVKAIESKSGGDYTIYSA